MEPRSQQPRPSPASAAGSRRLAHWHWSFSGQASKLQSIVLLFVRLCCGWELFVSGRGHLQIVPAMVQRFTQWGIPLPHLNVYISAGTECVGGLLILFGLAARLVSIPLIINFIVAYLTASHAVVKQLFAGPNRLDAIDSFTNDAAFFFLVSALIVLAFGTGKVSID
jgi:putative oxidoreductase